MNAKRTGLGSLKVRKGAELTPEPTAPGLYMKEADRLWQIKQLG